MKPFATVPKLAALLIGLWLLSIPAGAQDTPASLAIKEAPTFKERLTWIGSVAPTLQETSDLLTIVNFYVDPQAENRVRVGVQLFEEFLIEYPDSAWAPSIRA